MQSKPLVGVSHAVINLVIEVLITSLSYKHHEQTECLPRSFSYFNVINCYSANSPAQNEKLLGKY